MIPASFEYVSPTSLDEAIQLLQQHGDDAKLLAGGHSLIPLMKLRLTEPAVLIDLGRVPGLSYIRGNGNGFAVGAMTTHYMLESSADLQAQLPLVSEAASKIGDVQVRNRGTIGGSLVHADPGGDLPAVVLALGGELVLRGPNGERTVNADDFFVGMLTSATESNEILTEIRLPKLSGKAGYAYQKAANKASGYAIVGVAVAVALGDNGAVREARIGITGAGASAVRATAAEQALTGQQPTAEAIAAAAAAAPQAIDDPMEDIHASGEYRKALVAVHTRRALERAVQAAH
jgi:aerobic carbon-monoxide dehydrogenase medium subunit